MNIFTLDDLMLTLKNWKPKYLPQGVALALIVEHLKPHYTYQIFSNQILQPDFACTPKTLHWPYNEILNAVLKKNKWKEFFTT
ncbi:MAG: hypothetical protein IPN13_09845 [Bacteroidetes bacterium]|nr:hypothetical protein [Bacteroidota bacterium]